MTFHAPRYLRFGIDRLNVVRDVLHHPLNSHSRARTLLDYACWNLARRTMPHKVVLPMPNDLQIIVPNQSNFATGIYLHQLYDFGNMAFFCHLLRETDVMIDVGANVGVYGLLAAKSTGCQVIACEPAPDTFRTLADNVHLNGLESTVELHNVAVGASDDTIMLSSGQHGLNHVVDAQGTPVPQRRLDDLVGTRVPVALKIDVEGYEMHVLRGAAGVLDNPGLKAVMVEINGLIERYGETVDGVRAHLHALGFAPISYDPADRRLVPGGDRDEMFVRDLPYVADRIRSAPALTLYGKSY